MYGNELTTRFLSSLRFVRNDREECNDIFIICHCCFGVIPLYLYTSLPQQNAKHFVNYINFILSKQTLSLFVYVICFLPGQKYSVPVKP